MERWRWDHFNDGHSRCAIALNMISIEINAEEEAVSRVRCVTQPVFAERRISFFEFSEGFSAILHGPMVSREFWGAVI